MLSSLLIAIPFLHKLLLIYIFFTVLIAILLCQLVFPQFLNYAYCILLQSFLIRSPRQSSVQIFLSSLLESFFIKFPNHSIHFRILLFHLLLLHLIYFLLFLFGLPFKRSSFQIILNQLLNSIYLFVYTWAILMQLTYIRKTWLLLQLLLWLLLLLCLLLCLLLQLLLRLLLRLLLIGLFVLLL